MPYVNIGIQEQNVNIVEPLAKQSVLAVLNKINMTDIFKNEIFYNFPSSSTAINNEGYDAKSVRERLECTITPRLNPMNNKWGMENFAHTDAFGQRRGYYSHQLPIYSDRDIEAFMVERAISCGVHIECKAVSTSSIIANQLATALYNVFGNAAYVFTFATRVSYPLPSSALSLISMFYRMKNNDNSDGISKYLKDHTTDDLHTKVNTETEAVDLSIERLNDRIVASVEYNEDAPQIEKKDNMARTYTTTFSIDVQYPRPNLITASMPIVIGDHVVNKEIFLSKECQTDVDSRRKEISTFTEMKRIRSIFLERRQPVYVTPFYDTWSLPNPCQLDTQLYTPFLQIFIMPDRSGATDTLNISGEIDEGMALADNVKAYIKEIGNKVFYSSHQFHIGIFIGDRQIEAKDLSISDELVITFPIIEKYKAYRLIISQYSAGEDYGEYTKPIWLAQRPIRHRY